MDSVSHATLVANQFGARAEAYLKSDVHARGQDLDRLVELVRAGGLKKALDLGCGGGHVGFSIAPFVESVVACDLSPSILEVVQKAALDKGLINLKTERATAESLPFPDGAFDGVFSRYSAHHWSDFEQGLREAGRVLKRGGTAIFIDVVSPGRALLDTYLQGFELLRDPSHVKNYSVSEWSGAAIQAGFGLLDVKTMRLRLDFKSWVERMQTPPVHVEALHSLQKKAPQDVSRYFEIESDGSFTVDTAMMMFSNH